MKKLDDLRVFAQIDADGMMQAIRDFPHQLESALILASRFRLPSSYRNIDKIVVLGMGGSAIGGDLIAGLISAQARVPVTVSRGYDLPAYVDEATLVIASSYSGNTEETISAFLQALKTACKKLVITTGGKLKDLARRNRVPVCLFKYRAQPRAALGYSLGLLLGILHNIGIVDISPEDTAEAMAVLKTVGENIDVKVKYMENRAKQLAGKLKGKIVVTYGAEVFAEVAHRWKTQVNENSKAWSFSEAFSELNHNAIVGYEFPAELADSIHVVMLRAPSIHPRNLKRYELTANILERSGIAYEILDGQGEGLLGQVLSLVLYGDWVSYYLAVLYGADPSPVKVISDLKSKLA